ncbi:MAG: hypothetical protein ACFCU8_20735 [Thermosynechococcaceae cyanobacterium]
MHIVRSAALSMIIASLPALACAESRIDTTAELVTAVREGAEGETIEVAAGTYRLATPLELKAKMTLKGAGIDKTILTHTKNRQPSTRTLPDPEMTMDGLDTDAYLIRLKKDTAGITVSDMTLQAPQLHGAIFGWFNTDLHLHHLRIKETLWSGVRTFGMKNAKIHDNEFIDTGGRWEKGQPGVNGGITGGAIFAVWMEDSEIFNNRFTRTKMLQNAVITASRYDKESAAASTTTRSKPTSQLSSPLRTMRIWRLTTTSSTELFPSRSTQAG